MARAWNYDSSLLLVDHICCFREGIDHEMMISSLTIVVVLSSLNRWLKMMVCSPGITGFFFSKTVIVRQDNSRRIVSIVTGCPSHSIVDSYTHSKDSKLWQENFFFFLYYSDSGNTFLLKSLKRSQLRLQKEREEDSRVVTHEWKAIPCSPFLALFFIFVLFLSLFPHRNDCSKNDFTFCMLSLFVSFSCHPNTTRGHTQKHENKKNTKQVKLIVIFGSDLW